MVRNILLAGATGKQGQALIHALRPNSADPASSSTLHVLALTRNAGAPNAKCLSESHVTVVEGDLNSPSSIRKVFEDAKATGGVWGVFCVLAFPGLGANADGVETQGKALADLALEYGVSSFVFSSAQRGGEKDDDEAVLDRLAKVKIEQHVRELGTKGLHWTILRPGFFMENYLGTIGSITVAVLKAGLRPDTTVQLVAVEDIGHVGAAVLRNPSDYTSQVLVVVGDVLTMSQQEVAYNKATGTYMTCIPKFLAQLLISMNGHTRKLISDINRIHDLLSNNKNPDNEEQMAAARRAYSGMTSFETWAGWKKSSERTQNWNQVSILGLVTGRL